jgi:hypothetical protein
MVQSKVSGTRYEPIFYSGEDVGEGWVNVYRDALAERWYSINYRFRSRAVECAGAGVLYRIRVKLK